MQEFIIYDIFILKVNTVPIEFSVQVLEHGSRERDLNSSHAVSLEAEYLCTIKPNHVSLQYSDVHRLHIGLKDS